MAAPYIRSFRLWLISNLLSIEALINDRPLQDVIGEWAGETHYGDLKKKVAESVKNLLIDFQSRLEKISDEEILSLFADGEKYANEIANQKLNQVQKAFNLR